MTKFSSVSVLVVLAALGSTEAFVPARNLAGLPGVSRDLSLVRPSDSAYPIHRHVSASVDGESPTPSKKKTLKDLRAEGGRLTFNTPIGALNPFAIYYGIMSLVLGAPWFLSTKLYQFMSFLTRGRFDPKVRDEYFPETGSLILKLWPGNTQRIHRLHP